MSGLEEVAFHRLGSAERIISHNWTDLFTACRRRREEEVSCANAGKYVVMWID